VKDLALPSLFLLPITDFLLFPPLQTIRNYKNYHDCLFYNWKDYFQWIVKEVSYLDSSKTYQQWNGKNIRGQGELSNNFLASEANKSNTSEMQCIVGVDTFSGDDLQENIDS